MIVFELIEFLVQKGGEFHELRHGIVPNRRVFHTCDEQGLAALHLVSPSLAREGKAEACRGIRIEVQHEAFCRLFRDLQALVVIALRHGVAQALYHEISTRNVYRHPVRRFHRQRVLEPLEFFVVFFLVFGSHGVSSVF